MSDLSCGAGLQHISIVAVGEGLAVSDCGAPVGGAALLRVKEPCPARSLLGRDSTRPNSAQKRPCKLRSSLVRVPSFGSSPTNQPFFQSRSTVRKHYPVLSVHSDSAAPAYYRAIV